MAPSAVAISGAKVLLTGASRGLGGAIARAFDDRGARLVLTGRRTDALESLASGLHAPELVACDLARHDQVDGLLAQLSDIDIVVANAALPAAGALDDFTAVELDRALDVNLRTPMLLAHHFAPPMRARGCGHLVFISSMGGKVPASRLSIYAATKYGLRGFAACLRQELHGTGIGVSVVFPGSVRDVGMWARLRCTQQDRDDHFGRGRRRRDPGHRTQPGRGRRRTDECPGRRAACSPCAGDVRTAGAPVGSRPPDRRSRGRPAPQALAPRSRV